MPHSQLVVQHENAINSESFRPHTVHIDTSVFSRRDESCSVTIFSYLIINTAPHNFSHLEKQLSRFVKHLRPGVWDERDAWE